MVHAGFFGNGGGGFFIIAGEHDHLDAHGLKFFDGLGRIFFNHIGHRNETKQSAFLFKEEGRLSFFRQDFRLLPEFFDGGQSGNI